MRRGPDEGPEADHVVGETDERIRPDLLRLRARIVDGYFDIQAQVLECKLKHRLEDDVAEAQRQVAAGLRQLVGCFRPREEGKPLGLADRPDQRYWWMQLHRLIASRGTTVMPKYAGALVALERLSEGYFTISWHGAVVAFWTNLDHEGFQSEGSSTLDLEGEQLTVPASGASGRMIRRACLEGVTVDLFPDTKPLVRSFKRAKAAEPAAPAPEKPDEPKTPTHQYEESPDTDGSVVQKPVEIAPNPEVKAVDEPAEVDSPGSEPSKQVKTEPTVAPQTGKIVEPIPERILLGTAVPGGHKVYWEYGHKDLTNRHMLVFGASGTGKTYTIQALLCELAKAGQNALIVDYTSGFTNTQLETTVRKHLQPKQHVVRMEPLPINPFRQQADLIDDLVLEESPAITAQRVAGVFAEVYALGPQQKSALYRAISEGITKEPSTFNLTQLLSRLEELQAGGGAIGSSAGSTISKIQPFVDMNPFGQEDPESWEKLFADPDSMCHIIQLAGFSKDMARLITEFSLIDLYRYYRTKGNKDRPRVVVLDEIQNLDHSLESPLGQFLTEGRKFGISLILATQTLSNLEKEERDRLFQASHTLFFRPASTELKSVAQILADATGERTEDWVARLSALKKGECYSLGPTLKEGTNILEARRFFKVQITALPERF